MRLLLLAVAVSAGSAGAFPVLAQAMSPVDTLARPVVLRVTLPHEPRSFWTLTRNTCPPVPTEPGELFVHCRPRFSGTLEHADRNEIIVRDGSEVRRFPIAETYRIEKLDGRSALLTTTSAMFGAVYGVVATAFVAMGAPTLSDRAILTTGGILTVGAATIAGYKYGKRWTPWTPASERPK